MAATAEGRRPRPTLALAAIALAVALTVPACWPGRCEGGFRMLLPDSAAITPTTELWVNADSSTRTPDELLASSGVSPATLFILGPAGPVPATITARSITSAHSCASAATFSLAPVAPLAPGDYRVVLLLDATRWPLVHGSATTHDGHRALVRTYRVPAPP